MGTQLAFWRQSFGVGSPSGTLRSLADGRPPEYVESLPLEPVLTALISELPGLEPTPAPAGPRPAFWADGHRFSVELNWSDHHVLVELRGDWPHEVANRLIDAMLEFDCPLYDPQIDERFDS